MQLTNIYITAADKNHEFILHNKTSVQRPAAHIVVASRTDWITQSESLLVLRVWFVSVETGDVSHKTIGHIIIKIFIKLQKQLVNKYFTH